MTWAVPTSKPPSIPTSKLDKRADGERALSRLEEQPSADRVTWLLARHAINFPLNPRFYETSESGIGYLVDRGCGEEVMTLIEHLDPPDQFKILCSRQDIELLCGDHFAAPARILAMIAQHDQTQKFEIMKKDILPYIIRCSPYDQRETNRSTVVRLLQSLDKDQQEHILYRTGFDFLREQYKDFSPEAIDLFNGLDLVSRYRVLQACRFWEKPLGPGIFTSHGIKYHGEIRVCFEQAAAFKQKLMTDIVASNKSQDSEFRMLFKERPTWPRGPLRGYID